MMGTLGDKKGHLGTDEEHRTKEELLAAELMTTRAELYKAKVMIMELNSKLSKEPWSFPEFEWTKEETLNDMQKVMEKMRIAISNNYHLYKRMLHQGFDVLYSEALYDAGYRKKKEEKS